MNINTSELFVLAIPFMGTTLGAAMVFLLKDNIAPKLEKLLLGFASGVMIAASVWSLLIPSIDMQKARNGVAWLPALVGFLVGIAFLLLLDTVIPHLHLKSTEPEGISVKKGHISKTTMMLFAVTLHNIPEGMSVGVAYAGAALQGSGISTAAAFALAIGIAIISLPLCAEGMSRKRAFICGMLSGIVEPIGGFITILIAGLISPILPYLLSFAAGAMIYVVIDELIPESQAGEHSNIGTIGAAVGFALMMVLDVALG